MSPSRKISIERLGHLGDGLARDGEERVQIPFAAPGDLFEERGGAWHLAEAGAHRAAAPCPHYGACGGCNLQHVDAETYANSKREWLIAALARQGIETEVEPLVLAAPATRRRATFTAQRSVDGARIGFHKTQSRDVVEVPGCLIVRPRMIAAIAAIRDAVLARLKSGESARIAVTDADNGLDVAIEAPRKAEPLAVPEIENACTSMILRMSWNGDLLFSTERPRVMLGAVRVDLPPGAFLQATRESEQELRACVVAALAGARRIADLYAGLGTFSFALAASASVAAYDGHEASIAALDLAARRAEGLKPIAAECRDLVRRPLMAAELKPFDGAVLDPPRAGAEAQARQLARSSLPRIAYVSCYPASFAKDARLLIDGGYSLKRVTPVDQFLWSHHVELIGTFLRP